MGELLDAADSHELSEWMVYDQLYPLGDSWQQTGIIGALLVNLLSSGARRKPDDFIPTARASRQSSRDHRAIFMRTAGSAGQ